MALRALGRDTRLLQALIQQAARWQSGTPTVYDKLVRVTLIDKLGQQHSVRALEGQTVVDVLENISPAQLDATEYLCLGPEGRGAYECVATVPNDYLTKFPEPEGFDKRALEEIAPKVGKNTRLGSKIKFTKEMNGLQVALGDVYPWKTL